MIRDIVVTLILVLLVIGGLWTAGVGRDAMSSALAFVFGDGSGDESSLAEKGGEERGRDDLAIVAGILDDAQTWCFWPDGKGRCAWALRADRDVAAAGFDVSIYAARAARSTDAGEALEISVARSGLIFVDGRLCENRDLPTTRERLGYYHALGGALVADVSLRPATAADFEAFKAGVPDAGGAEVCFRFEKEERGAPDGTWLMHVETNGAEIAPPEEFVVRGREAAVALAPPP